MNKLAILAAAALASSTFGLAAMAQESSGGDFAQYDGNKDGLISWEEALGAYPTLSQEIFNQADANGDGSLDEAEFVGLQGLTAGADDDNTSGEPSAQ